LTPTPSLLPLPLTGRRRGEAMGVDSHPLPSSTPTDREKEEGGDGSSLPPPPFQG